MSVVGRARRGAPRFLVTLVVNWTGSRIVKEVLPPLRPAPLEDDLCVSVCVFVSMCVTCVSVHVCV